MKRKLALALTIVGVTIGLASTGTAQADDGDITVNVAEKVKIDVAPDSLAYGNNGTPVEPGTFRTTSDDGYTGVEVENLGSVNLSTVWVETSEPSSRPFGTGTAGSYDAGNMIQLRGTGEITGALSLNNNFRYAGRREYNESSPLSYVIPQSGGGTNGFRYGRFREGDKQFFWGINDTQGTADGGNTCAGASSSHFMVGDVSHSQNTLGSVDFTDSSSFNSTTISSGPTAAGEATISIDDKAYAVYTWCGNQPDPQDDSTYVGFHGWDRQAQTDPDTDLGTVSNYLLNLFEGSASGDTGLQPGEHFTVETRVSVPFGVAEGTVGSGNMTLFAAQ